MNFHIQSPRQKQLAQPNLFSKFIYNNNLQYPYTKIIPLFLPYRQSDPYTHFCSSQHPLPPAKNRLPGLNKFSNSNTDNQLQNVSEKLPGCFCLTGSKTHLPTSVPINIPRRYVSHLNPNHAPVHFPPISLVPTLSQ